MEFIPTKIPGCFQVKLTDIQDERGSFTKLFRSSKVSANGLSLDFKESFVTRSKNGVLRGLHFQAPPDEQTKAVTCISGDVFDVILDLRKNSPSYGRWISFTLSEKNPTLILIPAGCAHGFYVTASHGDLLYFTGSEYNPESDTGVLWSSAGIDWPITTPPILSERDSALLPLDLYASPFNF